MIERLNGLRFPAAAVLFLLAAILAAVVLLAWPGTALAQEPPEDPVTITSFGKVDPNPATHPQPTDKVDGEFEVQVSFNRRVTGFTADDFEVDHGSTSDLSVSNGNWTVTVTVDEGYEGPLTVTLPANAVDEGNAEQSLSFTVDQTGPTAVLSVSSSLGSPIPASFPFKITFSEPVKLGEDSDTGLLADILLQPSDFTLTTGTLRRLQKATNHEGDLKYSAIANPGAYDGEYTITLPAGVVQDAVGNPNMEATVSVAVDGVRPTVEITTRQGDYVQHGAQFDIRIEFSEAVQEFSESDIIVTEGTLVEDSLNTDDNIVWNAFVTAGSQGTTVKVDIPDRAARDAVRWWNTAAQRLSLQAVSLPSIPEDLILDQAREETLVFSWLGPESDGGAPWCTTGTATVRYLANSG